MAVKIGNNDITLKLGSADVSAAYIGDTLVYSGGTTPPIPPIPIYRWVLYNEGDTVPSTTFYGVKLYTGLGWDNYEIDFSVDGVTGVAFIYDVSNDEWTALDMVSSDPIDISGYFDGDNCYTILFSDIGYGGMLVSYPITGEQFVFDIDLYEQI